MALSLSVSATVGTYEYVHIPGKINPADILSKHWGYLMFGYVEANSLFWCGNTGDLAK